MMKSSYPSSTQLQTTLYLSYVRLFADLLTNTKNIASDTLPNVKNKASLHRHDFKGGAVKRNAKRHKQNRQVIPLPRPFLSVPNNT